MVWRICRNFSDFLLFFFLSSFLSFVFFVSASQFMWMESLPTTKLKRKRLALMSHTSHANVLGFWREAFSFLFFVFLVFGFIICFFTFHLFYLFVFAPEEFLLLLWPAQYPASYANKTRSTKIKYTNLLCEYYFSILFYQYFVV